MTKASVSHLKARLSEYLDVVKRGKDVLVTERGRPVAVLGPPPAASGGSSAETERLIRMGILLPAKGPLDPGIFQPSPVKDPKGLVRKALIEDRRTR